MKKIIKNSVLLLIICMLLLTGCKKKVDIVNTSNTKDERSDNPSQNVNVNGSGSLKCTRSGNAMGGLDVDFNYYVTYKDGIMLTLHSVEKVFGDNKEALKKYEEAYKVIREKYKDLKYYDVTVTVEDKSVTNDINIDYEKVDTAEIIAKESDSIFDEKKRPVLKKWLELGKKAGLTCEGVVS